MYIHTTQEGISIVNGGHKQSGGNGVNSSKHAKQNKPKQTKTNIHHTLWYRFIFLFYGELFANQEVSSRIGRGGVGGPFLIKFAMCFVFGLEFFEFTLGNGFALNIMGWNSTIIIAGITATMRINHLK
jgi:hypothetical protein